jgi:hypothetical protein
MGVAVKPFRVLLLVCVCASSVGAFAEVKDADLSNYLAGVSERGRAIYEYDQAAWHGTDAFFALKPDTKGLAHYICINTPSGWKVVFPKWNEAHDRMSIVYEARQSNKPGTYVAVKFTKPIEAKEELVSRERALDVATADFGAPKRPFNSAILPAAGGNLYVYFYPGQTKEDVFPLGGDIRYTVSSDGKRIIEKRQLHKSILDTQFKKDGGQVSGFHSHILSDVPEDTDVLYVLNRKPAIPEYIGAGERAFVINPDGKVERTKLCGKAGPAPCEDTKNPKGASH